MADNFCKFKAPASCLPAGLISWFAPDGSPVALVTSWMALIGGDSPRIRTAWHGRQDPLSRFWAGGDFVLNIPDEKMLFKIQERMRRGGLCFKDEFLFGAAHMGRLSATTLCLSACCMQIECCNGVLLYDGFEPELSGEVMKIHHKGAVISPDDVSDLFAIRPLS